MVLTNSGSRGNGGWVSVSSTPPERKEASGSKGSECGREQRASQEARSSRSAKAIEEGRVYHRRLTTFEATGGRGMLTQPTPGVPNLVLIALSTTIT